jgi:hypothetical protein
VKNADPCERIKMKVFVKWKDDDGKILEEVTELITQDKVYVQGTDISFPIETLGSDRIIFEDEYGLWGVKKEDIIEIRQILDHLKIK